MYTATFTVHDQHGYFSIVSEALSSPTLFFKNPDEKEVECSLSFIPFSEETVDQRRLHEDDTLFLHMLQAPLADIYLLLLPDSTSPVHYKSTIKPAIDEYLEEIAPLTSEVLILVAPLSRTGSVIHNSVLSRHQKNVFTRILGDYEGAYEFTSSTIKPPASTIKKSTLLEWRYSHQIQINVCKPTELATVLSNIISSSVNENLLLIENEIDRLEKVATVMDTNFSRVFLLNVTFLSHLIAVEKQSLIGKIVNRNWALLSDKNNSDLIEYDHDTSQNNQIFFAQNDYLLKTLELNFLEKREDFAVSRSELGKLMLFKIVEIIMTGLTNIGVIHPFLLDYFHHIKLNDSDYRTKCLNYLHELIIKLDNCLNATFPSFDSDMSALYELYLEYYCSLPSEQDSALCDTGSIVDKAEQTFAKTESTYTKMRQMFLLSKVKASPVMINDFPLKGFHTIKHRYLTDKMESEKATGSPDQIDTCVELFNNIKSMELLTDIMKMADNREYSFDVDETISYLHAPLEIVTVASYEIEVDCSLHWNLDSFVVDSVILEYSADESSNFSYKKTENKVFVENRTPRSKLDALKFCLEYKNVSISHGINNLKLKTSINKIGDFRLRRVVLKQDTLDLVINHSNSYIRTRPNSNALDYRINQRHHFSDSISSVPFTLTFNTTHDIVDVTVEINNTQFHYLSEDYEIVNNSAFFKTSELSANSTFTIDFDFAKAKTKRTTNIYTADFTSLVHDARCEVGLNDSVLNDIIMPSQNMNEIRLSSSPEAYRPCIDHRKLKMKHTLINFNVSVFYTNKATNELFRVEFPTDNIICKRLLSFNDNKIINVTDDPIQVDQINDVDINKIVEKGEHIAFESHDAEITIRGIYEAHPFKIKLSIPPQKIVTNDHIFRFSTPKSVKKSAVFDVDVEVITESSWKIEFFNVACETLFVPVSNTKFSGNGNSKFTLYLKAIREGISVIPHPEISLSVQQLPQIENNDEIIILSG